MKNIIIRRLPNSNKIDSIWAKALIALQKYDHSGNKTQDIDGFEVSDNKTNYTIIYCKDV